MLSEEVTFSVIRWSAGQMLFITKNNVRKEVVKATQMLLRAGAGMGGLPQAFWTDKRIIAFLFGTITGLISLIGKNKYEGPASSEIAIGVLQDLAGKTIGLQGAQMLVSATRSGDRDFTESLKAGYLSVMVGAHGISGVLDEPIVRAAVSHAERLPNLTSIFGDIGENSKIASAIQDLYFGQQVFKMREAE
jgi:hypothetical protein